MPFISTQMLPSLLLINKSVISNNLEIVTLIMIFKLKLTNLYLQLESKQMKHLQVDGSSSSIIWMLR